MKTYTFTLLSALLVGGALLFAPLTQADEELDASVNDPLFKQSEQTYGEKSYGDKVAEKALHGITNINSAPLEIPKNIINMTNQTDNIILGIGGGFIKGFLHTVGRAAVGVTDLITAPIVTKPIAQPTYIWDDFDADTTYGPIFRLDNQAQVDKDSQ